MTTAKTVEISRLSHQGEGIAFVDENTWFVAKALPGEDGRSPSAATARAQCVCPVQQCN